MFKRRRAQGQFVANKKRKMGKTPGSRVTIKDLIGYAEKGYKAYNTARKVFAPAKGKQAIIRTTTQGDSATLSTRGARKTRAQRRFKRFAKKVVKAQTAFRPSRTYLATDGGSVSVVQADLDAAFPTKDPGVNTTKGFLGMQRITTFAIATYDKTDGSKRVNDLNQLYEINYGSITADAQQLYNQSVYIKSFLFEIMLNNIGTNALYADLYYWQAKRTGNVDTLDLITAGDAQVQDENVGATSNYCNLAVDNYGWTPYQLSQLTKYCNIFKKERYYLPAGAVTQIEWRGKIGKMFKKEQTIASDMTSVQNKIQKGMSRGIFMITYGVPQSTGSGSNNQVTGTHTLRWSFNKTIYWNNVSVGGNASEQGDNHIQAVGN